METNEIITRYVYLNFGQFGTETIEVDGHYEAEWDCCLVDWTQWQYDYLVADSVTSDGSVLKAIEKYFGDDDSVYAEAVYNAADNVIGDWLREIRHEASEYEDGEEINCTEELADEIAKLLAADTSVIVRAVNDRAAYEARGVAA